MNEGLCLFYLKKWLSHGSLVIISAASLCSVGLLLLPLYIFNFSSLTAQGIYFRLTAETEYSDESYICIFSWQHSKHNILFKFCDLSNPLSVWCCIEMQYVTWLIPSVEQMSDVQMCMRMLLLLAVRAAVGVVSMLLYLCLYANGCLRMHVRWQFMYFPMLRMCNTVYVFCVCLSVSINDRG